MKNCPVCDRKPPLNPQIIGIQEGPMWDEVTDKFIGFGPALILWQCLCNTTRATEWDDATEPQKAEARQVMLCRDYRARVTA